MVKLYADYQKLSSYAKMLEDNCKRLDNIRKDMQNVVADVEISAWNGADYQAFCAKFSDFTNLLTKMENNIANFSEFILGKVERYDKAESYFKSQIKGRRNV